MMIREEMVREATRTVRDADRANSRQVSTWSAAVLADEVGALMAAVERVRALAFDRMSHGGGNAEEIWSSEILDALQGNPAPPPNV